MPRIARSEQIVHKMEELALDLLKKVHEDNTPLDAKLDVFQQVGAWVKIKSKMEDDDGGAINEYKRRLQSEDTPDRPARRKRGEGAALDRFKSRLPPADAGDLDGDRDDAVGPDAAAA